MLAVLTCSDSPRERRLRLGQLHASSSTLIALIKWSGSCRTDRSMNQSPQLAELNGRGHAPNQHQPHSHQTYELTNLLHLTPLIGVRPVMTHGRRAYPIILNWINAAVIKMSKIMKAPAI